MTRIYIFFLMAYTMHADCPSRTWGNRRGGMTDHIGSTVKIRDPTRSITPDSVSLTFQRGGDVHLEASVSLSVTISSIRRHLLRSFIFRSYLEIVWPNSDKSSWARLSPTYRILSLMIWILINTTQFHLKHTQFHPTLLNFTQFSTLSTLSTLSRPDLTSRDSDVTVLGTDPDTREWMRLCVLGQLVCQ